MKFRYSEWQDSQDKGRLTFDELMKLFNQLLLHSNGSIHEALEWMTELDMEYNVFDDGSLSEKTVFVHLGDRLPDGLAVSEDGAVWVALAGEGGGCSGI